MQLMWLSSPTATVHSFSITAKHVIWGVVGAAIFLFLMGMLFQFLGLRLAIEFRPSLAQSMAGVASQAQVEQMEAGYRAQVDELKAVLKQSVGKVQQLQKLHDDFKSLHTPEYLQQQVINGVDLKSKAVTPGGRGGPWIPLASYFERKNSNLNDEFEVLRTATTELSEKMDALLEQRAKQNAFLATVPMTLPMSPQQASLSSTFGRRLDPFNRTWSMHEGLDLSGPVGTPVYSGAEGIVEKSERDASYGEVIEIRYAHGFVYRYAHLHERFVFSGQTVKRGQAIGSLGSSGRSTGPHLHYEVRHEGQLINPEKMLPARAKKSWGSLFNFTTED